MRSYATRPRGGSSRDSPRRGARFGERTSGSQNSRREGGGRSSDRSSRESSTRYSNRGNSSSNTSGRGRGGRNRNFESRDRYAAPRREHRDSTLGRLERESKEERAPAEPTNMRFLKPRTKPAISLQDSHRKDRSEGERIAKRIARCGICSRRDAEELIRRGAVSVDGSIVTSPALNVLPGSRIVVNGQEIQAEKPRLLVYNKPAGVIVQNLKPGEVDRPESRSLGSILQELDLQSFKAVGRLDINTEGLLLLTNDGELKRFLELPSSEMEREYRVRVFGEIDPDKLAKLKDGVEIDGFQYRGCDVTVDKQKGSNAWLTVKLKEGKNREIKVIMDALNLKVNRLIRVRFGPYEVDPTDLPEGDIQEIPIHRDHMRHVDPTWRWETESERKEGQKMRRFKSKSPVANRTANFNGDE